MLRLRCRCAVVAFAALCLVAVQVKKTQYAAHWHTSRTTNNLEVLVEGKQTARINAPLPAENGGEVSPPAPPPASLARSAAPEPGVCELLFGIPTVVRPGGADYLNLTLTSLLCQIDAGAVDDLRVCIAVYEVHARHDSHTLTPFDKARRALATRKDVIFVRGDVETASSSSVDPSHSGKLRLRQTRDVVRTLTALAPYANRYYVLLEDDWLLCEGGLEAIRYLVRKASVYQPAFSALRFSYGLNGLLLPAADVPALASFLRDPAAETENKQPDAPVDHLSYRWLRGKYAGGRRYFGRRHMMAFRHTLFWHIGDASAVGNTKGRHRPKCYGLTKEWLFEQESFHADECPDDDVWPCRDRPVQGSAAAFELGRLAALVERRAPGAHRCGSWRVCWERPAGQPAMRASQCAARLLCSPGTSAIGAVGVSVIVAAPPCVPREPQYEDRQVAGQRGML